MTNQEPTIIAVGIDVAKETLSVCIAYDDGRDKIENFGNIESDIKKLAGELNAARYAGKIVMESTGRHHMLSAIVLTEANLDVRVINPLITRKYSTAAIRKVKTDKRDAQILAEIAIKETKLPPKFDLTRSVLMLRKKLHLIASLEKQIQQLKAMINEYQATAETLEQKLSGAEKQIVKTIMNLKEQKDQLIEEIEQAIANDDIGKSSEADRFNSIPGVSFYVAALSALLFSKEHGQSAKQWIAYSGIDVSVKQSGNWHGRCKLTKRGNDYLRKRLYSAAWGAVMHNEQFKQYYDKLKANGRNHVEALVIIARKIIRIMFTLAKNNTLFDASMLSI